MSAFVRNLDWIRTKLRCTVLVVHHTGKDESKGERGNVALRGACDSIIRLEETDAGKAVLVHNSKQKDFEPFGVYKLTKTVVDVGGGESSLVMVSEANQWKTRHQLLRKDHKDLLARLHDAHGVVPFSYTDGFRVSGTKSRDSYSNWIKALVARDFLQKTDNGHYKVRPDAAEGVLFF